MGFVNRVDHAQRRMFATAEGPINVADIQAHLAVERRDGGLAYSERIDARQPRPSHGSTRSGGRRSWSRPSWASV